MQFMALIYSDEAAYKDATPEDGIAMMQAYNAFSEAARQAGVYVTGDALEVTTAATTVRVRDGERLLTDGPFAETKEQLGGYYLLECADLDEALAWASRIPGALYGSVEVRPIMDYSSFEAPAAAASEATA